MVDTLELVLVANPDLIRVTCRTPRQMHLANALGRLLEMATASGETITSRSGR